VRSTPACESQDLAEAPGVFRPALLRQPAGYVGAILVPGEGDGSRREIGQSGQVKERRQQVLFAHLARIGQLRNAQQLHVGRSEGIRLRVDLRIGQG
jgi:hypothetical protein